jgi:predicted esterase
MVGLHGSRPIPWFPPAAWLALLIAFASCLLTTGEAAASKVLMTDGRTLEGKLWRLASTGEQPTTTPVDGAPEVRLILLIDDDLRRTFIPKGRIQPPVIETDSGPGAVFNIRQNVVNRGSKVVQIGPLTRITPFDDFGRRIVTMQTNQGPIDVIQGITRITPNWTKIDSIQKSQGKNFMWDMRVATSSIPPEILRTVVHKHINPKKADDRVKLVRLFLLSERYQDAEAELRAIIQDFPALKQRFEPQARELRQAFARKALGEINVRRDAGQHRLAINLLEGFPTEGVAGEVLQAVKRTLDEYRAEFDRNNEVIQQIDAELTKLSDEAVRERAKAVRDEIAKELNLHSMNRLAAFRQFVSDPDTTNEDKLALAISGWLVGTDDALRNLAVAVSLHHVRDLVQQYLAEPIQVKRNQLLAEIAAQEGATPELVSKLLRYLLPPLETEPPADGPAGFYDLPVDGLAGDPRTNYLVQLPPEYDPHHLYPTIITLNGAGTTPQQQVDWWAGAVAGGGQRVGQATRYGYIVIAPTWAKQGQTSYDYSASEHTIVLNALRDACRRFAIDTDRVFLTGHSMGGDAAWDIGVAHPDLWAGVVPIVARADKYISLLWPNLKHVPFYLVGGELDGDFKEQNAKDLDRYFTANYNVTAVEYLGRGHENFSDEIQRLFDWMKPCRRNFFPKDFKAFSLRPWDNFFWWLELDEFAPKTMIDPDDWPAKRPRPAVTEAKVNTNNGIHVKTGAGITTLWLSPEIIDFNNKVAITVNGGRARLPGGGIEPSLAVLLEDARTRADRQHVFWAKVEMPSGKVNGGTE